MDSANLLITQLDKITNDESFYTKDPEDREFILGTLVDRFVTADPENAGLYKDLASERNKDLRRALGEGRAVPKQLNIQLPKDYEFMSEDDKVATIDQIRATNVTDPNDYLNAEDNRHYADAILNNELRKAQGSDTGYISDKSQRVLGGFVSTLANNVGASSLATDFNNFLETNPQRDDEWVSKFADGLGSVGATFLTAAAGTALAGGNPAGGISAVAAGNAMTRYNEGYNKAVDLGLDELTASRAGLGSLPGAVIDTIADQLLVTKLVPVKYAALFKTGTVAEKIAAVGEYTATQTGKRAVMNMTLNALGQGVSEASGDATAGYGAYYATGGADENLKPAVKDLIDSFTVGLAIGGTVELATNNVGIKTDLKDVVQPDGTTKQVKERSFIDKRATKLGEIATNLKSNPDRVGGVKLTDKVFNLLSEGNIKDALTVSNSLFKLPKTGVEEVTNPLDQNQFFTGKQWGDVVRDSGIQINDAQYDSVNHFGYRLDNLNSRLANYDPQSEEYKRLSEIIQTTSRKVGSILSAPVEDQLNIQLADKINESLGLPKQDTTAEQKDETAEKYTKPGVFDYRFLANQEAIKLNRSSQEFLYGVEALSDGTFGIIRSRKTGAPTLGETIDNARNFNEAMKASDQTRTQARQAFERVQQNQAVANIYDSTIDELLGIGQVTDQTQAMRDRQQGQEETQLKIKSDQQQTTPQGELNRAEFASQTQKANVNANALAESFGLKLERKTEITPILEVAPDWESASTARRNYQEANPGTTVRINKVDGGFKVEAVKNSIIGVPTAKSAEESMEVFMQQEPSDLELAEEAEAILGKKSKPVDNTKIEVGEDVGYVSENGEVPAKVISLNEDSTITIEVSNPENANTDLITTTSDKINRNESIIPFVGNKLSETNQSSQIAEIDEVTQLTKDVPQELNDTQTIDIESEVITNENTALASLPDTATAEEIQKVSPILAATAAAKAAYFKTEEAFTNWLSSLSKELARFAKTIWENAEAIMLAASISVTGASLFMSQPEISNRDKASVVLTSPQIEVAEGAVDIEEDSYAPVKRPELKVQDFKPNYSFGEINIDEPAPLNQNNQIKDNVDQTLDELQQTSQISNQIQGTSATVLTEELSQFWINQGQSDQVNSMARLLNENEKDSKAIKQMLVSMGINENPSTFPWCATCTSWALNDSGITQKTYAARKFLEIGTKTTSPSYGDVVVMWNTNEATGGKDGWGGHVGLYLGESNGNPVVISGNSADSVNVAIFPKERVLAYKTVSRKTAKKRKGKNSQAGFIYIPTAADWAQTGTNLKEAVQTGAAYFNSGLQNFAAWSEQMVTKFGEGIRNLLQSIWQSIGNAVMSYMEKTGIIQYAVDPNEKQLNNKSEQLPDPSTIWDSENGIGTTPDNKNIGYRGFTKMMRVSDFRKIAPPGVSSKETKAFIVEKIKSEEKLGKPMLYAEWNVSTKQWEVDGHEGRSRVDAIKELYGDILIPVDIFPRGAIRARSLTDEMREAAFIPENGGESLRIVSKPNIQELTKIFNQLTKSLYLGRDYATEQEIDEWKKLNPEKWNELSQMREQVLRDNGFTINAWHGSPNDKIDIFEPRKAERRIDSGRFGLDVTYFSNQEEAKNYTWKWDGGNWVQKNPYNVFLKIENPLVIPSGMSFWTALENAVGKKETDRISKQLAQSVDKYGMAELLLTHGYDGIYEVEAAYQKTVKPIWATVSSSQIKTAEPVSPGLKIEPDQWASDQSSIRYSIGGPAKINGGTYTNAYEALAAIDGLEGAAFRSLIAKNPAIREALLNTPITTQTESFFDGVKIGLKPNASQETTLHEVTHATLDAALDSNTKFSVAIQTLVSEAESNLEMDSNVRGLLNRAREAYTQTNKSKTLSQFFAENIATLLNGESDQQASHAYALTGTHEFLATIMSDGQFRSDMDRIVNDKRSVLRKMIDAIREFFIGQIPTQSILNKTLAAVERAVVDPSYDAKLIKSGKVRYQLNIKSGKEKEASPRSIFKNEIEKYQRIIKEKITDKGDSSTMAVMSALSQISINEALFNLDPSTMKQFFDLVKNIYNSRSSNVSRPDLRYNSNEVIAELNAIKIIADNNYIAQEKQKYQGIIDFSRIGDVSKEEFVEFMRDQMQVIETAEGMAAVEKGKTKEAIEKKYKLWREQYRASAAELIGRHKDANGFIEFFNQQYDHPLTGEVESLVKFSFQYLTGVLDVETLRGKELFSHYFAINAMLDGHVGNLKIATKEIARIKDETIEQNGYSLAGLVKTFRDKNVSDKGFFGRIANAIDKVVESTEIAQVSLQRWSAYPETQRFLQDNVMGDFFKTITQDVENDIANTVDEYVKLREVLTEKTGKPLSENDRILSSIYSRLRQVKEGVDPSVALLQNIKNERKAINNVINAPSRADQDLYLNKIKPMFDRMVDGLEQFEGDVYGEFLRTAKDRVGLDEGGVIGQARIDYVNGITEIFSRYMPTMQAISEGFHGKPFTKWMMYVPRETVSLTPELQQLNIKSTAADYQGIDTENSHLNSQSKQTKDRVGIGENKFYSHNIEATFMNQLNATAFEAHTTPARWVLDERLRDNGLIYKLMDYDTTLNREGRGKPRIDSLNQWAVTVINNALTKGEALGFLAGGVRSVQGAYATVALSSFHQFITQPLAGFADYVRRTSNYQGLGDALKLLASNREDVDKWFKDNSRWITNRSLAGEQELDVRRAPIYDEKSIINNPLISKINEYYKGSSKVLLTSMRVGDDITARAVVLAEYMRLMKQAGYPQGASFDFNEVVNGRILSQAILNAEKNINTSKKTLRGEMFTDRKLSYSIARNLLFAFSSHQMSLSSQLVGAVRDLKNLKELGATDESKEKAVRTIGAILMQNATFSISRYGVNALIASSLIGIVRGMYGDDDDKIARLERARLQAIEDGDKQLASELEVMEEDAKTIRSRLNKFQSTSVSTDGFFKSSLREGLSSLHMVMASEPMQKLVAIVPDLIGQNASAAAKEETLLGYKRRIKQLKEEGNLSGAARLTQEMEDFQDIEYIPLSYQDSNSVGVGGITGAALGNIYKIATNTAMMAGGLTDASYADVILSMNALGIGQNDATKFFKLIDRIENDLSKKEQERLKARETKAKEEAMK